MLTRSRRLLILGCLALGVSLGAEQVPAVAGHFDSRVAAWAAPHSDCPMHRAHLARAKDDGVEFTASGGAGSLLSAGRAAVFAP